VMPAMDGVTFSGTPAPGPGPRAPEPPVTIASDPDPGPPPPQSSPTVIYAPPVLVPLPNILIVNPPSNPGHSRRPRTMPDWKPDNKSGQTNTQPPPAAPPSPDPPPSATRTNGGTPRTMPEVGMPPKRDGTPVQPNRGREPVFNPAKPLPREKQFRDSGESQLLNEALKNVRGQNYPQALAILDTWTRRYRTSDFADDRAYYYMQAYTGLHQPAKVFEAGAPLMSKDLSATFEDPMQVMGVLYLASLNLQKLAHPSGEQLTTGVRAAHGLLAYLPICFTPQNKPPAMSNADWTTARTSLEVLAKQTIALAR
jgi:hypothetical protein